MSNRDLRAPLRELLDEGVEHAQLERIRRRVHASRRLPRQRAWRWGPPVAAAAVAILALVAWRATLPEVGGPLRLTDGSLLTVARGAGASSTVSLSDGSTIALSDTTVVETLENTSERVVLLQSDGAAVYRVRPGGPRRWTIDAGALVVDVVGTRFTVERHGMRARVEVQEGRVRARGAGVQGGLRTLGPGEWIEVGRAAESASVAEVDATDPTPEEVARVDPPPPTRRGATAPPSNPWRELAERGAYREALEAIGRDRHREASRQARDVDELFALADIARLGGEPALAVEPLRRVMEDHARDPRAAVAAFTLGRLQLDALDAPAEAAVSLERAEQLGLPARLEDAALARLVEAHRRAGHRSASRAAAARYLREHPDGRSVDRIRAWLEAEPIE